MKTNIALTVLAVGGLLTGCSLFMSPKVVAPDAVPGLVESGIEAYNNGDLATARNHLETALRSSRTETLKATRAQVHFYLAALAWDLGDAEKTDDHLGWCLSLNPEFEPDWTFLAPGLRSRFEDLK